MQEPVDERMHILVGRDGSLARTKTFANDVEPALDGGALFQREHSRMPERDGPRFGESHVERPQPVIDSDRPIEGIELRGRTAREATAP
jgi:hypothetical protein